MNSSDIFEIHEKKNMVTLLNGIKQAIAICPKCCLIDKIKGHKQEAEQCQICAMQ